MAIVTLAKAIGEMELALYHRYRVHSREVNASGQLSREWPLHASVISCLDSGDTLSLVGRC